MARSENHMTVTVRNQRPRVERALREEPDPRMHVAVNGVPLCGHHGDDPAVDASDFEILPSPDGCEFEVTCMACLVAPALLARHGVVP